MIAFKNKLSEVLRTTTSRETFSATEVQDLLLELWSLLPEDVPGLELELTAS